jgi:hypothetical protein
VIKLEHAESTTASLLDPLGVSRPEIGDRPRVELEHENISNFFSTKRSNNGHPAQEQLMSIPSLVFRDAM